MAAPKNGVTVMGVYNYCVKHNGVFYRPGEHVPDEPVEVEKEAEPIVEPLPKVEQVAPAKPKGRPKKK